MKLITIKKSWKFAQKGLLQMAESIQKIIYLSFARFSIYLVPHLPIWKLARDSITLPSQDLKKLNLSLKTWLPFGTPWKYNEVFYWSSPTWSILLKLKIQDELSVTVSETKKEECCIGHSRISSLRVRILPVKFALTAFPVPDVFTW